MEDRFCLRWENPELLNAMKDMFSEVLQQAMECELPSIP